MGKKVKDSGQTSTNPEGIVRECTSTKGIPSKARLELLRGNHCAYKKHIKKIALKLMPYGAHQKVWFG